MPALSLSYYDISIDEIQINATDLNLRFRVGNGCIFKSVAATDKGTPKYELQRGPVKFTSMDDTDQKKIILETVDLPDGENKESIDKLHAYLEETKTKEGPKEYAKTITICGINVAKESTFSVNFSGCVTNIEDIPPTGSYEAARLRITISITNTDTLKFGT